MTGRSYRNRIEALEQNAPSKPRHVFRVVGGHEGEAPADFLKAQGCQVTDTDMILHRQIMRPSANGPVMAEEPMRLISPLAA